MSDASSRRGDRPIRATRFGRLGKIALALILVLSLSACASSTRRYTRSGTAGAVTFLAGGASILVGREIVSVRNERAGRGVVGLGATAQAVGLLLIVYAMDGLIQTANPHVNERPRGFRDDVRSAPGQPTMVPWSVRRVPE